jgi:hypothetical protein
MGKFDFNIDLFTRRSLPTRKREITHIEWLASLFSGIQFVYNSFLTFRDKTLLELSYNSQTLILEKALNDKHDPTLKRIYIDNIFDNKTQEYIFTKSEDLPLYIFTRAEGETPPYLYNRSEFVSDFDFVIYVPADLTNLQTQIAALATFYKLASIRFEIIIY